VSNDKAYQPKFTSHCFWLGYHAWHCAVTRWEGYLDSYYDAQSRGADDEQYVCEILMTEAANDGSFWESVVNSYWLMWRN